MIIHCRHPADIDLWSGGVSEKALPGSMLGPTFACIIATQLSYIRRGDRFWYELPNQPSTFTPEQLQELRKAKLSRVICDNTDLIDTVQIYPMILPDHELCVFVIASYKWKARTEQLIIFVKSI